MIRPRALRRPDRDERGAVVPIVATLLGVLILITGLTVDIGEQRVARTDMQSLSDLVALDLSRQLGGSTAATILANTTFRSAVVTSVNRNGTTIGSTPKVVVEVGTYASSTFTSAGSLTYQKGDAAVGNVVFTSGAVVPTAVRVSAGTSVGFAFVPGTGAANRSAVAVTDSSACYEVGSFAAAVNTGNSALLGPLLGALNSNLNLTAASYQGLANTAIKLSDLAVALGVGSVDQLATTSVSYQSFYLALAQVLTNKGQTAYVSLLNTLAASASSGTQIAIGSLVTLGTGTTAAANAVVNLLDLLAASATVANGSTFIDLPIGASIPGIGTLSTRLKLIQGIQKYCGRVGASATTATPGQTSQIDLSTTANLTGTNVSIPLVGSVSVGSPANSPVTLSVQAAPTKAQLSSVTCKTASSSTQSVTLAMSNGLLTESLTVPLKVTGQVSLLGLPLVNVTITTDVVVSTTISPTSTTMTITIPPQAFDTVYSTGTSNLTLGTTTAKTNVNVTATTLLGIGVSLSSAQLDSILDPVVSSVVPGIVNGLNSALLSPLLNLLGVRVGGADVIVDSTPALSCSVPTLRQ